MTAADRILIRKAECAAILDLLRPRLAGDTARIVEARLAALADALMEAQAAQAEAVLAAAAIRLQAPQPARADVPLMPEEAKVWPSKEPLASAVAAAESLRPPAEPTTCCGAYAFDLGPGCDRGRDACPNRDQWRSAPPPAPTAADVDPVPQPGANPSGPDEGVAPSLPAAESGHPSTAGGTAPAEPVTVWSGERIALLRTLFPQPGFSLDDILARLNALPGPAISSTKAVKVRASTHGLRRPTAPPTQRAATATATVWSAERIALLREIYPQPDLSRRDVLERINALPGPPCASLDALKKKAMALGLLRAAATAPDTKDATATPEGAAAPAIPPPAAAPAAEPAPAPAGQRIDLSPDRAALLREMWPQADVTISQIAVRLNELPGARISSGSIYWIASKLGLGSRKEAKSAAPAATPPAPPQPAPVAARPVPPLPAPAAAPPLRAAPPSPPAPTATATTTPADARRRALAMLREGYSEQQIVARTGMPLAEVTAMVSAAEAEARNLLLARMPTEAIIDQTGLPAGAIRALRREMSAAGA